ncbi:MAG: hypothetical protein K9J12_00355 [Melioribacteraceae bacterium]|nr:hypothetical protein [Melioribacteraceae bacterium]MCF8264352.1 hypothetical protein [Melioribacteraceae bacterium]MCF8432515.1 hypothetical protein [Melioribacteraceae bacterium]
MELKKHNSKFNSPKQSVKIGLGYLIFGVVLLLFSGGKWNIPIASWLAPVFFIRFSRGQRPLIGFIIILPVSSLIAIITWEGLIPVQGPPYYVIHIIGGLFTALTYLIDRLVATRINNFLSTLIFPLTSVAFGFLHISTSLYGANGSLALTQNNLLFLQILSITGMWGVIFLITWFASFINWIWERNFKFEYVRIGTIVYIGVMVSVFLFGIIRLSFFPPNSETIRIASISSKLPDPDLPTNDQSWDVFKNESYKKQTEILALSKKASIVGAEIVTWREGEIYILKEDETEFVKQGSKLAEMQNMFLGMSIAVFTKDFPNVLAENKIVWIDTTGTIIFEYFKALPTPTEKCVAGDGEVKMLNYSKSKIASTICFDLDFPNFISKFGREKIDIMLSPANDWYAIARIHPQQVSFRAIENGFSLVRPNPNFGLATAFDYQGKMISYVDFEKTKNEIMISDVPVKGVNTIYNIIGDFFAWISSIGIVLIIIIVIFSKKNT